MNAAEAIGMLDQRIAEYGQPLKFKRGAAVPVDLRGFVRGFKPSELVGTLKQGDRSIVLSPSGLGAFGVPSAQDKVALADGTATVQSVERVHIGVDLVRINLVVRGD